MGGIHRRRDAEMGCGGLSEKFKQTFSGPGGYFDGFHIILSLFGSYDLVMFIGNKTVSTNSIQINISIVDNLIYVKPK
jgi:hypothetical protein